MASCPRSNENKPFLVHTIDKQPVGLDVAFAMTTICPAERMVAHRIGKRFSPNKRLKGPLELREVLALALHTLVVLLELSGEPQSSMAYSSSSAAIASLTVW